MKQDIQPAKEDFLSPTVRAVLAAQPLNNLHRFDEHTTLVDNSPEFCPSEAQPSKNASAILPA